MGNKILPLQQFLHLRQTFSAEKKTLVLTNGCFDILHLGHVRYLQQAKALGDLLIIGLNSDTSVHRIKGPDRPIVPENERAEVLAALEAVDYVVIFDEPTAEALVEAIKPDIYVKGGDYGPGSKSLPEAQIVKGYGGRVTILPLVEGISTTSIIEKILQYHHGQKGD